MHCTVYILKLIRLLDVLRVGVCFRFRIEEKKWGCRVEIRKLKSEVEKKDCRVEIRKLRIEEEK